MSSPELQDNAIITNVLSGNRDAFQALVRRYFETVRMVALAKTGNATDAEDVAQETFLKAYATLGTLRNRDKAGHWLVTIARNIAVSVVRRRERERRHASDLPREPRVYPAHEKREFFETVAQQVEALPVPLREVVLLHYFEGLKCREIAERLGMSTNAVVKRLSRGRDVLGDRLLRAWGEGQSTDPAAIQHVLGAIALLPQPDWSAQLSGPAGSSAVTGGALKAFGITATRTTAFEFGFAILALLAGVSATLWYIHTSDDVPPVLGEARPSTPAYERAIAPPSIGQDAQTSRPTRETAGAFVVARIAEAATKTRKVAGFVSGTVVATDGSPIHNARVHAFANGMSGHATSNPNGTFRINIATENTEAASRAGLPTLAVTGNASGFVPYRLDDIPIDQTNLRIELTPPARFSGAVRDADSGAPLREFMVRTYHTRAPADGQGVNPRERYFNAQDGAFSVESHHGIASVTIESEGYVARREPLNVALGESREGDILTLERAGIVHGLVFDKQTRAPIPDFRVTARFGDDHAFHGFNGDGSFAMPGLPRHGPITLEVGAHGYATERISCTVNTETNPISIFLGRGGSVRGRVIYEGGPPPGSDKARIEDGYCRVNIQAVSLADAKTDEPMVVLERDYAYVKPDGAYEVTGLKTGLYRAQAFFWPGASQINYSVSKLVMVKDGQTTALDLSYDVPEAQIILQLGESKAAFDARVELLSDAAPDVVLEGRGPAPVGTRDLPRSEVFSKLESGLYSIRVYAPNQKEFNSEASVEIASGEAVDVYVDVASNAADVVEDSRATEGDR